MNVTEDLAIYNPFKYKVYLQWNPVNAVTNGPNEFGCINGVLGLTMVFFTRKCAAVFARQPKKSGHNNKVTV